MTQSFPLQPDSDDYPDTLSWLSADIAWWYRALAAMRYCRREVLDDFTALRNPTQEQALAWRREDHKFAIGVGQACATILRAEQWKRQIESQVARDAASLARARARLLTTLKKARAK